jgi:membrane protein implicated in regulation of membrane protease activity
MTMLNWLFEFNGLDFFFLVCALVGGVLLVLRLLLMVIGIGADGDGLDLHHADSDVGFKLLSIQGITAFLTMFGLVGFSVMRGTTLGATVAVIAAVIAGFGSAWIIGRVFIAMLGLQSSGSVAIEQAVGCTGTVYVNIPKQGSGSVQINIAQRLREFDAVSASGDELATGTAIKVTRVAGSALAVEKL